MMILLPTHRCLPCLPVLALAVIGFNSVSLGQLQLDEKLVAYKPASGLAGQLKTVGSDSMNPLMLLWTEKFKEYYKGVRTEVEGQGSSKAMPALLEGSASFGPMSRDAKGNEIADFEKKYGYKPVLVPVAVDLLAIFVHRDNPLESISIEEIDSTFSNTRKLGGDAIDQWGQLGLGGDFEKQPITLFGRNAASGTYVFFKEKTLGNGDYRDTVNEQPGSTAVVQSVGENRFAIGYSGVGFATSAVKPLAVSLKKGDKGVAPTSENAYNGEYPLARNLYLALNFKPGSRLDPLRREFIRFVLSKEGQALVIKEGSYPVDAKTAQRALKLVGMEP